VGAMPPRVEDNAPAVFAHLIPEAMLPRHPPKRFRVRFRKPGQRTLWLLHR